MYRLFDDIPADFGISNWLEFSCDFAFDNDTEPETSDVDPSSDIMSQAEYVMVLLSVSCELVTSCSRHAMPSAVYGSMSKTKGNCKQLHVM